MSVEDGSCTGKVGYLTWDKANRALSGSRYRRDDPREGRVTVYRCRHCAAWHVGKSKGEPRRG